MTMNHLCISKYDIKYRNELGVYLRDDWTSFFDIGKVWEGELLTREEYERVEKNYLDALRDIAQFVVSNAFEINSIEMWDYDTSHLGFPFVNGSIINLEQCLTLAKDIIREKVWCKIESEKLNIYCEYDYYIYISFEGDLDTVKAIIKKYDLFWEMQDRKWFEKDED